MPPIRAMPVASFNPRDLIRPPCWDCPFCEAKTSFGVLHVGGRSYTRRCKECWRTQSFELPNLNVKTLYLDQFFLSNIVRVLDPRTSPARLERLKPHGDFYRTAFEKIHRLCKLHLLVCPDSPLHYDESVVSPDFRKLKRLWELLSHGATLLPPDTIRNRQVLEFARKWLGLHNAVAPSRQTAITGRLNEWQDWFQITLNTGVIPELPRELRETRDKKFNGFLEVYEMWKREKHRGFDYWLNEERTGLSRVLKERLAKTLARELLIRSGRAERRRKLFSVKAAEVRRKARWMGAC